MDQALAVLAEVHAAVSNWRQIALSPQVGLRATELDDFAPAFEHDQLEAAATLLKSWSRMTGMTLTLEKVPLKLRQECSLRRVPKSFDAGFIIDSIPGSVTQAAFKPDTRVRKATKYLSSKLPNRFRLKDTFCIPIGVAVGIAGITCARVRGK